MIREVVTENGRVRGLPSADPRVTVFKGIPFAAPPVGENRWRAPQPCESWEETLLAYEFAPISVQDQPGIGTDVYCKERGHSERIIEDFMIAANVCVASFLKWQDIPTIYRVHEEPQARRIKTFVQVSEAMGHKFVIGKSAVYPNEIQPGIIEVILNETHPDA